MKLKGALLGAGNIALRGHAPQWLGSLAADVEIVAIADLSSANRETASALFPAARVYESAEEALGAEALDFCDICTPPFTHLPLIEAAAQRGIHVLCEKPLAPTLNEALQSARTIRDAGIAFQPCHQYNYAPPWQAVVERVPRLGPLHFVEYSVKRTAANEGNAHWAPEWRTRRDLSGGGILVDHGAHILYQLRGVMGEPQRVSATVRTLLHHGYGVEDTAVLTLDHGAALAEVSLTWAAKRREISYRFVGERGELVGDESRLQVIADTTEEVEVGGLSGNSSHSEWFGPLFKEFVARVRSGIPNEDPLDEAVYVARIIERAYASSRMGQTLSLSHDGAEPLLRAVRR